MQKGDYISLCLVNFDYIDGEPIRDGLKSMYIAPPWTVEVGDKVILPDSSLGVVEFVRTLAFESDDYFDFLKVSGTVVPSRLKGRARYEEFDWSYWSFESAQEEAQAV